MALRILQYYSLRIISFAKVLQRNYSHTSSGLSYFHKVGKTPLVYRNIGQELSRVVEAYPDHEIVISVEENKKLTNAELLNTADSLAAGFQCLGLKRGDRLGILAPNVTTWPVAMFAAARAGLVMVALNPAHEGNQLEFYLQKVGVKAIVTSESFKGKNYYDNLLNIIPELTTSDPGRLQSRKLPHLTSVIIDSETNFNGALRLKDVKALPTSSHKRNIEDQQKFISPESGCTIQFTSGSTGEPKAAILKHLGVVNSNLHMDRLEFSGKRLCCQVPFFHGYGTEMGIITSVFKQATMIIPSPTFNPEKSLVAIKNEKCSAILGTPAMYLDMLRKQREIKLDISLDVAVIGGAVSSKQLFIDMMKELGVKKFKTCYGLTETGYCFTNLSSDDLNRTYETVGHVQDHIEVKVTDHLGNLVPFGVAGELWIRGYFNMLGYWGSDEVHQNSTEKVLGKDGWLRTGDMFILQPDGYGKIMGRISDLIIRDGKDIYPRDIENILASFMEIAESYIVGVPDEDVGEELCLFVRLHADYTTLTPQDIKDLYKRSISDFPVPRYVEIVKEFPQTLTGKVPKVKLKKHFAEKYLRKDKCGKKMKYS